MQSGELMQTITGVAVALTGFSGVVVVLGPRAGGSWSSEDLLQLRTLVEPSLVALFGSLVPGIIGLAITSEPLTWRLANGVLGILGLVSLVAFLKRSRMASTTVGQRVLVAVTLVGLGAIFLAAADVLPQGELVFVLGLVIALVVAAYNFLLLLFSMGRPA